MPHDPQIMLAFIAGFSPQDIFSAIVKNLPTLVWVLLVPYLLYKNPQGRELLTGMFDEADAFTGIRAGVVVVMFHLIALALFWMPTAVLPDPDLATEAERVAWLKEKLSPVTGKNLSAAVIVCALPLALYAVVLFRVQLKRFRRWWSLLPALGVLALGIWGVVLIQDEPTISLWKLDLLVVGNMLLAYSMLRLIQTINAKRAKKISPVWNYLAVIFCLCLQLPLIAASLEQADYLFHFARHTYELHYLMLLISVVVVVVAGAWAPNLQSLSPTFVLLGITLFYLLMGDLLGGAFLLLGKNTKIVLAAVLAVFGYLMFLHRSHIHDVRLQPSKQLANIRQNLDAYFEAWWAGIDKSAPGEIPIFLMAAQGGGSRAGYWTSQLANRLNIETGAVFAAIFSPSRRLRAARRASARRCPCGVIWTNTRNWTMPNGSIFNGNSPGRCFNAIT